MSRLRIIDIKISILLCSLFLCCNPPEGGKYNNGHLSKEELIDGFDEEVQQEIIDYHFFNSNTDSLYSDSNLTEISNGLNR